MEEKYFRLGCDIGGTFTDFVLLDDKTGQIRTGKCLTTPRDPSDAVEQGIRTLEAVAPGFVPKLHELIHGTTLVINAIIERKGARTALITTKGFRDVLEIGREMRYAPYDIFAEFPRPLISNTPGRSRSRGCKLHLSVWLMSVMAARLTSAPNHTPAPTLFPDISDSRKAREITFNPRIGPTTEASSRA